MVESSWVEPVEAEVAEAVEAAVVDAVEGATVEAVEAVEAAVEAVEAVEAAVEEPVEEEVDIVFSVAGVDVVELVGPVVTHGCPGQQGLEGTGVPVVRQLHS